MKTYQKTVKMSPIQYLLSAAGAACLTDDGVLPELHRECIAELQEYRRVLNQLRFKMEIEDDISPQDYDNICAALGAGEVDNDY